MSQSLYRKWRPHRWEQVVGQEHIIQTLRNAVAAGKEAHAYLFSGPRGTGKTTTARLLAKAVNCLHPEMGARPCDECAHCQAVNESRFLDLIEIDAASNTSVDHVRDLRDKINFSPNQGRYKIYLIDEVHMLSTAAFNALLKTLEEPPPHAIFILATTEIHKIPATVLSRCQLYEFRRIPVDKITAHLRVIASEESLEAEEEALSLVARQATGSLRDAISLLDQLASSGSSITLEMAQEVLGTATSQSVMDIVDAIISKDPAAGLEHLHRTLDAGADARQFARQMVDYLRDLLLISVGNAQQVDASKDVRQRMEAQMKSLPSGELLRVIRAFNAAATETRSNWQPGLPLELAFVESIEPPQLEGVPSGAPAHGVKPPPKKPAPARPGQESAGQSSGSPQKSAPPAASHPEASTLRQIQSQWPAIREVVRKINGSAGGLLNSCTILDIKGNRLYLGFASDVLKSKMEEANRLSAAEKGIEEVLGMKLQIRCVIASGSQSIPPEVEDDGMVAMAVRLGGKIVGSQKTK